MISSFNLPDPDKIRLSDDLSALTTTFSAGPNLEIRIVNPAQYDYIALYPSHHCGPQGPRPGQRLGLVKNGYEAVFITALQIFRKKPLSLHFEATGIEKVRGPLTITLRFRNETRNVIFEKPNLSPTIFKRRTE